LNFVPWKSEKSYDLRDEQGLHHVKATNPVNLLKRLPENGGREGGGREKVGYECDGGELRRQMRIGIERTIIQKARRGRCAGDFEKMEKEKKQRRRKR